jgi:apolipoprotein N-acyltransferase
MSTAMRMHQVRVLPRSIRIVALLASLAASATLTGILRASPTSSGLIWVCLLPLIWAIRSFHPVSAALVGAGWGLGVCVLPTIAADSLSLTSPSLLIALPLLTGAYAALGALASRAFRFVTPILAFGWILVELPLAHLHLPGGLLIGLEAGDALLGWFARLFGYALAALLVVGVNASLLSLLCTLRLRPAAQRSVDRSCATTPRLFDHHAFPTQWWVLREAYPRGPPG